MGFLPGAVNIPVGQLRKRMGEVPQGKKLYVYCQVGAVLWYQPVPSGQLQAPAAGTAAGGLAWCTRGRRADAGR